MRLNAIFTLFSMALLAAAVGCQSLGTPGELTSDSLLKAAGTSPDAVTLDIYWARTNRDDPQFGETLWSSVQEDRLPVELRCALARDGLRAGVVGGTPSEALVQLLNPAGAAMATTDNSATPLSAAPPKVTRRLRQLSPNTRLEIQATDTPRAMNLLRQHADGLAGQPYDDAQGIYAMQLVGRESNRAVLQLAPELHYGQPRMQYTAAGPGMVVQKLSREVELFEELRLEVALSPGEMLVITSLPNAKHHLGGLFHHAVAEGVEQQKYLLVRLSQVPDAPALAATPETAWPWN